MQQQQQQHQQQQHQKPYAFATLFLSWLVSYFSCVFGAKHLNMIGA